MQLSAHTGAESSDETTGTRHIAKSQGKERPPRETSQRKHTGKDGQKKRTGKTKVVSSPRWRLFQVEVALSEDAGKDSVEVSAALEKAVDASLRKLCTAATSSNKRGDGGGGGTGGTSFPPPPYSIQVVRKSFDARLKRGGGGKGGPSKSSQRTVPEPTFSYVVDLDFAAAGVASASAASASSVEFSCRPVPGTVEPLTPASVDGSGVEENKELSSGEDQQQQQQQQPRKKRVVVVGAGPAGLFAALALAEVGGDNVEVVVVERGQPVHVRGRHIGALLCRRKLDAESNLCFGEGGAGTWSDGKLATQIGKNSDPVRAVLSSLVEFGAPKRILVDSKPHLGTDRMVTILRSMREGLVERGVTFRFGTRVDRLVLSSSTATSTETATSSTPRVAGVELSFLPNSAITYAGTGGVDEDANNDKGDRDNGGGSAATAAASATRARAEATGAATRAAAGGGGVGSAVGDEEEASGQVSAQRTVEVLEADHVVLAVGHSARALYNQLAEAGVPLQPKGFAVGFRIEHPQETINEARYKKWASMTSDDRGRRGYGKVPVADYKLTATVRVDGGDDDAAAADKSGDGSAAKRDVSVPATHHEGHRSGSGDHGGGDGNDKARVKASEVEQCVDSTGGSDRAEESNQQSPPPPPTSSFSSLSSPPSSPPLAALASSRAVYSFCMCPGGQIVPTSMDKDHVCINGMSFSKRSSKWANSALVVTVHPHDEVVTSAVASTQGSSTEEGAGGATPQPSPSLSSSSSAPMSPLVGVQFQEMMEAKAAEMGGGDLVVPVQRVADFLAGRSLPEGMTLPASSYKLGVKSARLDLLYPPQVTAALKLALSKFERQMPGFASDPQALLHGVETRTSAPVTIPRLQHDADDDDGASNGHAVGSNGFAVECVGVRGLWPCGEGAGHAGGIVSAAVDGIRVAAGLLRALEASAETTLPAAPLTSQSPSLTPGEPRKTLVKVSTAGLAGSSSDTHLGAAGAAASSWDFSGDRRKKGGVENHY